MPNKSTASDKSGAPESSQDGNVPTAPNQVDDAFTLFDLRVEVVACRGEMVCNHQLGDYFELRGENLSLPPGQTFPIYPLAALLPLLPAKQRQTHPNDWMTTDTDIACPDPLCGAVFRIQRIGQTTFRHQDVTRVPLPPKVEAPRTETQPAEDVPAP